MIFVSLTHLGKVRRENQDALGHLETNNGALFVVCDGVSGLPNGAIASQTAVSAILENFSDSPSTTPKIRIKNAMTNGQKHVMKTNPTPLGTTAVTCYFHKNKAYVGWCGDSRIYHFRNNITKSCFINTFMRKFCWIALDGLSSR